MIDVNKENSLLYINSLLSFSLLFALVVLICFESSHIDIGRIRTLAQSETIKKPLTDDRTYEIIQMENDLVLKFVITTAMCTKTTTLAPLTNTTTKKPTIILTASAHCPSSMPRTRNFTVATTWL